MATINTDFGTPHRQAFIAETNYLEQQRQRALLVLGTHWLLHPANSIKRHTPAIQPTAAPVFSINCVCDTCGNTDHHLQDGMCPSCIKKYQPVRLDNIPAFIKRRAC